MRVLDTSHMEVVYFGREWPFPDIDPSSKQCICELERNEGLVTWLQPIGGGLEDQIPSIRVGDKFCSLSLRMQKSLFRHVRLKKDFINKEPMSNGSYKLRIPLLLLQEKIRTQTRFNVSVHVYKKPFCISIASLIPTPLGKLTGHEVQEQACWPGRPSRSQHHDREYCYHYYYNGPKQGTQGRIFHEQVH